MPCYCRHRPGSFWLIFVILSFSACAKSLPQLELRTYQDSVTQTREAATEVLGVYADDVQENKANQAKAANKLPPFERTFDLEQVLQKQKELDTVGTRLIALQTITRYTDLLVTLAEGKSVEQVQNRAGSLIASLETIGGFLSVAPVPGLQLATPLLKTVIGELEKARTREQFRTAVEQGEVIIVKILAFLEGETPLYYRLAITLFDVKHGAVIAEVSSSVRDIIGIVASHQAPSDPNFLKNTEEELNKTLGSMAFEFEAVKLDPQGTTPFSSVAQSQIRLLMENVTAGAEQEKQLVADLNAYYQMLETYVILLKQTEKSLHSLRVAFDKPLDVQAEFENTLRLALQLRQQIQALRKGL